MYNHYKHHADLMYNKLMTLTELNDLIPFERKIYVDLFKEQIEASKNANQ